MTALLEPVERVRERHGSSEVPALREVATGLSEQLSSYGVLDTLGDQTHAEGVRESHAGLHDGFG